MKIYRVRPPWNAEHANLYPWVDSADGLLDPDEIWTTRPLISEWAPVLLVPEHRSASPDAFCCPAGFFVFSERCRDLLGPAVGTSAEWLPVGVQGSGRFYIMHPLRDFDLGPRAEVTTNSVSGNITVVARYDFVNAAIASASVFYISHPVGSAARAVGSCRMDLLTTEAVADAWRDAALTGVTFEQVVETGSA